MSTATSKLTSQAESDLIQKLEKKREEHRSSISGLSPGEAQWKRPPADENGNKRTFSSGQLHSSIRQAMQRSQGQQQDAQNESPHPERARQLLKSRKDTRVITSSQMQRSIYQTMPTSLFQDTNGTRINAVEEEDMSQLSVLESHPNEEMPLLANQPIRQQRRWSRNLSRKAQRMKRMMCKALHHCQRALSSAFGLYAGMLMLTVAWILSRYCNNPTLHALPKVEISVSWWLHFAGRQLLIFEASRVLQWVVVHRLTERSPFARTYLGPPVALLIISSKGWPFLVSAWSTIDMFLLYGDRSFVRRWVFAWTDFSSYAASEDGGMSVLCSDEYRRVLYCILLTGVVVSIKRCWVTIRVGSRVYAEFKPRFEKMLQDICLVSEIAELGRDIDRVCAEHSIQLNEDGSISTQPTNLTSKHATLGDKVGKIQFVRTSQDNDGDDSDEDDDTDVMRAEAREKDTSNEPLNIMARLERWKEPNKEKDHKNDATIEDILKFECAIQIMGQQRPFGKAFGDASTRDECVLSAQSIYRSLLKLTPHETDIPYDTLMLITQNCEQDELENKVDALRSLFRPNRGNILTELAFVSSCDAVYRRLRYFYASVANAVVLDSLIMRFVDVSLSFFASLAVLITLRFNPLPVLLSVSTAVLSFTFAMGKAVAEYVDGIVLIVFRRPYDLGDRIVLTETSSSSNMDLSESYFVEGIDLYTTTLRFARTNEVSTVPNGSLSSKRIVNCNRSPAATVLFTMIFKIDFIHKDGEMLDKFIRRVRVYIAEHPRMWETILFHRIDSIDVDAESVHVKIGIRHRNSWQNFPSIMQHKGELNAHMYSIGEDMGMNFSSPPGILLNYEAGSLKSGKRMGYKADLLASDNIYDEKKEN